MEKLQKTLAAAMNITPASSGESLAAGLDVFGENEILQKQFDVGMVMYQLMQYIADEAETSGEVY